MKKLSKIAIVNSLILVISISLILITDKSKKIETSDEFKSFNNDMLSIMLQKDLGGGDYIESTVTSFPQEYYNFNSKLSKCLNGSKLKYNEDTKTVNVETAKTDKCYAYFDKNAIAETYEYTGHYETFNVPVDGEYKIELWGASGGDFGEYNGGKGAYTIGNIVLNKNEKLYIYVGNTDTLENAIIFNGGGSVKGNRYGGGGGGATDIRLTEGEWNIFDSLKSRIMVAAGGGGANNRNIYDGSEYFYGAGNGGYGGALAGGDGESLDATHTHPTTSKTYGWVIGKGATQTSGGNIESHCNFSTQCESDIKTNTGNGKFGYAVAGQSGGGGGYYAGATSLHAGGGGGSSFISGHTGCNAIDEKSTETSIIHTNKPNHYSGKVFMKTQMIAGNSTMPKPDGGTEVGHTGNGYAKITLVK